MEMMRYKSIVNAIAKDIFYRNKLHNHNIVDIKWNNIDLNYIYEIDIQQEIIILQRFLSLSIVVLNSCHK